MPDCTPCSRKKMPPKRAATTTGSTAIATKQAAKSSKISVEETAPRRSARQAAANPTETSVPSSSASHPPAPAPPSKASKESPKKSKKEESKESPKKSKKEEGKRVVESEDAAPVEEAVKKSSKSAGLVEGELVPESLSVMEVSIMG